MIRLIKLNSIMKFKMEEIHEKSLALTAEKNK